MKFYYALVITISPSIIAMYNVPWDKDFAERQMVSERALVLTHSEDNSKEQIYKGSKQPKSLYGSVIEYTVTLNKSQKLYSGKRYKRRKHVHLDIQELSAQKAEKYFEELQRQHQQLLMQ